MQQISTDTTDRGLVGDFKEPVVIYSAYRIFFTFQILKVTKS